MRIVVNFLLQVECTNALNNYKAWSNGPETGMRTRLRLQGAGFSLASRAPRKEASLSDRDVEMEMIGRGVSRNTTSMRRDAYAAPTGASESVR